MKAFSILVLALFSIAARAETLTCVFTTPFISIMVDPEATAVIVTNEPENKSTTYPVLETQVGEEARVIFGAGEEANWRLAYREDGQGSDGMSDFGYPYSARAWIGNEDSGALHGGCYSASKPRTGEVPTVPNPIMSRVRRLRQAEVDRMLLMNDLLRARCWAIGDCLR